MKMRVEISKILLFYHCACYIYLSTLFDFLPKAFPWGSLEVPTSRRLLKWYFLRNFPVWFTYLRTFTTGQSLSLYLVNDTCMPFEWTLLCWWRNPCLLHTRTTMEGRQPSRTTNTTQRARMVWMWVGGQSARTIAQATGASVSTVYRWIRRWEQEGNIHTRPRTGKYQICLWRNNIIYPSAYQENAFRSLAGFSPYFQLHYNAQSGQSPAKGRHSPLDPSLSNFTFYLSDKREWVGNVPVKRKTNLRFGESMFDL